MATSRRPPPTNAEQNRVTLKNLVKLEANKSCADCKKNKHPRWASWNLGIFVCIRCSGIHRGMGTHISRVKSVDLDSWTDEQTQSMIKWGNARANAYWEAKLAVGHMPSESKIENYIRTKYESKRWVMDGPMPDPSTLDVGETSTASVAAAAPVVQTNAAPTRAIRQNVDLFADDPPARPSTGPPLVSQPPPKSTAAPPKQSKPAESLLGLDFFGSAPTAPARPASASTQQASKSDLKQSILSLYASAPKPAPQPQTQTSPSFGGFQSGGSSNSQTQSSAFGGLGGMNDAFASLNVTSSTSSPPSQPSAFSNLTSNFSAQKPISNNKPLISSGGSFFDATPNPPAAQKSAAPSMPSSGGFGDLFSSSATTSSKPAASASASNDLFDFSAPSPPRAAAPAQPSLTATATAPSYTATNPTLSSAFNLSSNVPQPVPKPAPVTSTPSYGAGMDAWGSSDVWGAPESNTSATNTSVTNTSSNFINNNNSGTISSSSVLGGFGNDEGWGSTASPIATATATTKSSSKPSQTTIAADEDFGGWNSAPTVTAAAAAPSQSHTLPKPANSSASAGGSGFNAPSNDDVFGNVWG